MEPSRYGRRYSSLEREQAEFPCARIGTSLLLTQPVMVGPMRRRHLGESSNRYTARRNEAEEAAWQNNHQERENQLLATHNARQAIRDSTEGRIYHGAYPPRQRGRSRSRGVEEGSSRRALSRGRDRYNSAQRYASEARSSSRGRFSSMSYDDTSSESRSLPRSLSRGRTPASNNPYATQRSSQGAAYPYAQQGGYPGSPNPRNAQGATYPYAQQGQYPGATTSRGNPYPYLPEQRTDQRTGQRLPPPIRTGHGSGFPEQYGIARVAREMSADEARRLAYQREQFYLVHGRYQ